MDMDKLKEILKPLIEERDDAAEIITQIQEATANDAGPDIDKIREEIRAEERAANNAQYIATFFKGEKPEGAPEVKQDKPAEPNSPNTDYINFNDILEGIATADTDTSTN